MDRQMAKGDSVQIAWPVQIKHQLQMPVGDIDVEQALLVAEEKRLVSKEIREQGVTFFSVTVDLNDRLSKGNPFVRYSAAPTLSSCVRFKW